MNLEPGLDGGMSRREFSRAMLLGGAVLLGGTSFFAGDSGTVINGPAEGPNGGDYSQAGRLETPAGRPPLFKPWEAGETVYEAPNDLNWVAFRGDDGPWRTSSRETQKIFNDYGIGI